MQASLAPWALWLCAGMILSGCSSQPQVSPAPNRVETTLVSHTLSIDPGEPRVLTSPQRTIRITEQKLQRVTEFDAQNQQIASHDNFLSLPWANQTLTVIAEGQRFPLRTDQDGMVRLNLLHEQFVELDFEQLRGIELVARSATSTVAETDLLISRELRTVLREAVPLIYNSLEEDDVTQWVQRVRQLTSLGLSEESTQLENMLILLTVGDPELQFQFIQALQQDLSEGP